MDIRPESEQGCVRAFALTIPAEEISPLFEEAAREVKTHAALPGFRAGKVPVDLIKTRFRKEIREEVLEHHLPEWAREVQEGQKLEPVVEPHVEDLHFEEGEPLSCKLVFEVAPVVPPIPDYATRIEVPAVKVDEARVEEILGGLPARAATLKPVEGAAEEGDYIEVTLLKKGQSKPFPLLRVASEKSEHPIERAILGHAAGDAFPLSVPPAEDPKKRTLAPGEYTVTVARVSRREMPPLDDDLARTLGAESLEALRTQIRDGQEADLTYRSRAIQEDKILDELLARHPFDVPPSLVDRQLRGGMQDLAESLASQGIDPEKALDWNKVADSQRPEAQRRVRSYYLLDAVAAREAISVSEEELDAYFASRAAGAGKPEVTAASLRKKYERDGEIGSVRKMLEHRGALDLLLSKASVTFVEGQEPKEG